MEINEKNARALNEHQKTLDVQYNKMFTKLASLEATVATLTQRLTAAEQLIKIKFTGTGPSVR